MEMSQEKSFPVGWYIITSSGQAKLSHEKLIHQLFSTAASGQHEQCTGATGQGKETGWELLESFWYLNRLGTSFCEAVPLLSWPPFLLWSITDWVFTEIFLSQRRKKKKPQNTTLLVSVRLLLSAVPIQRQLMSVEILVTSAHTDQNQKTNSAFKGDGDLDEKNRTAPKA